MGGNSDFVVHYLRKYLYSFYYYMLGQINLQEIIQFLIEIWFAFPVGNIYSDGHEVFETTRFPHLDSPPLL